MLPSHSGTKSSPGSDTTGRLDNGMPLVGYGVRKILSDFDNALSKSGMFSTSSLEKIVVPWNLWGDALTNMVTGMIEAAATHANLHH